MCDDQVEEIVEAHADNDKDPADWDWKELEEAAFKQFRFHPELRENLNGTKLDTQDDLVTIATERVHQLYDQREAEFTPPMMRQIEKFVMLQTLDGLWKDHLLAMDHLKEGIGLRGYAQRNPLVEYQKEGYDMFEAMMRVTRQDVVEKIFSVQVRREQDVAQVEQAQQQRPQRVQMSHGGETVNAEPATAKRDGNKLGRNDLCHCGSGKKYKKCHGK
jgi:preprotein translocase subunit SecA